MGTFKITSSTQNDQYEYKNANVIVNGGYLKDATTGMLTSINGMAYAVNTQGEQGDYIGHFSGSVRDGEIRYSLSEMSRRQSNLVWDAIDEIEANILGENE